MHGILIYYIIYKVENQPSDFPAKILPAYIPFISDAINIGRILIFP